MFKRTMEWNHIITCAVYTLYITFIYMIRVSSYDTVDDSCSTLIQNNVSLSLHSYVGTPVCQSMP